ncbi:MAG: glycosyltransferase [Verrucomicrobiota bacterium]|nr:glycosyltransferase [Chthoniobacterales bacterium]MDQ3414978.1 glycosyltransferase [Verrucomicrobiota bacterium]
MTPVISVLMPVYNPALRFLEEVIESVRAQSYAPWELCVADDRSTDERVRPFLEEKGKRDSRIKLVFREANGGIAACSNSALALAGGDWGALLDQDDLLAENALSEVAREITAHPDAGLIYSDEDFVDASGERINPFFKPDWNPELFLGQNYLNHLGVYRLELLREIGGFRAGFEGSQDYDLALRTCARLRPEQIRHIPRILYHWRMVTGSLADQPDAKPEARHAARRALNSYLREQDIAAEAVACQENAESHRVIYELPKPPPEVAILRLPAGAAEANRAARATEADVLIFLSDEIEADDPAWSDEMLCLVVRPEIGAVGARLWSASGTLEDGALILGLGGVATPAFYGIPRGHPGYFNRAWLTQNFSAVSAACLAVRKDVFLELNGFDERNLPEHFYDVDFCLRLRERGLQVVWTPYANLTWRGAGLRPEAQTSSEAVWMKQRWGEQLERDPFYNPNLSRDLPGFRFEPCSR